MGKESEKAGLHFFTPGSRYRPGVQLINLVLPQKSWQVIKNFLS